MQFFKGVLASDLRVSSYVPGTVAVSCKEAAMWRDRIRSTKSKGAAKHVRHGKAVVICFEIDETAIGAEHLFQQASVAEHSRPNCWTSAQKTKAQINTPVTYKVLSDDEVFEIARM